MLLRDAVRNDVVLDAGVDLAGHDSTIEELIFAAVRAETDDARCPGARQSRHLEELIEGGRVDVDRVIGAGEGLLVELAYGR